MGTASSSLTTVIVQWLGGACIGCSIPNTFLPKTFCRNITLMIISRNRSSSYSKLHTTRAWLQCPSFFSEHTFCSRNSTFCVNAIHSIHYNLPGLMLLDLCCNPGNIILDVMQNRSFGQTCIKCIPVIKAADFNAMNTLLCTLLRIERSNLSMFHMRKASFVR